MPHTAIASLYTEEALRLAKSSSWLNRRSIKLFLATSTTALMFRNKDVHEYAKATWHTVAAASQGLLSDFFEVCYLGLSETCLYSGLEGRLKDCSDACGYLHTPGSPPSTAMTVSDTIPAQSFRSYVSLVWANVQAAGALNMQAIEGALVQPICANLVEQQMSWSAWQSETKEENLSFDTFVQQCARQVVSTATMKQAMRTQADHILKGYDEKVLTYFPFMKNSLPLPKEAAIAREVHAHRAVLKERVASTLAELAVVPQAKIRASFHLVYFCEQLGLTSAQDSGHLPAQDPFDNVHASLKEQLDTRQCWRSLKADELVAVMSPWTDPRGRGGREPRNNFDHRNKLRSYTQVDHAMRSACHILRHTTREMHKMCKPKAAEAAAGAQAAVDTFPLQAWEQDMTTELKEAMQSVVHGLADDVRCAALQGVAAIPPEVRQIVLSKLEPHRWSKHQAWCFRLKPQRTEDAPMPRFYGWLDRRAAMMAHLNLLHPGNALMANLQAVVDDINDGDDDEDMWAGLDH